MHNYALGCIIYTPSLIQLSCHLRYGLSHPLSPPPGYPHTTSIIKHAS
nr:MAG TPA: hypothetical protein [Caudoviricetes sp.]